MSSAPSLPSNPTPAYSFANQPAADTGAFTGITQFGQNASNINNAYNAAGDNAAGTATVNAGTAMLPYASQALQTGFDPQKQLYAQQYQQQQDQTNASNAQNGVAGTPYGAEIADNQNQKFDINWQNQQLGRQSTAANTAGALTGAGGRPNAGGTAVGQSVAQLPQQQLQQTIQDFLSYLQGGTGATNAGTSQYSAEAQASLGQQKQDAANLAGLGNLGGNIFTSLFV